MKLSTFFIDLDETLYATSTGLWQAIRERIDLYMLERMNLPREEIPALRRHLFSTYGTTMRGLQAVYEIDEEDYLQFVHDVPLEKYLSPNPALRQMLLSFPQRKLIFTNADANHARRVLNTLALEDCFEGILDINAIDPYCKPMPEAFQIAMAAAGEKEGGRCLMADDALANLATARQMGFFTVHVGSAESSPDCHASIEDIIDLPKILDHKYN